MKQTPLHSMHLDAGAKMGEFAGYDMPLFYELGVMKEHLHTRSHAGLFDVSHMVHISIEGSDSGRFLSHLCPFIADELGIGASKYTFFLDESGGIIDDLIVTRLSQSNFLVVANAGCAEKDIAHIESHIGDFDATPKILSRGFLAVQGPEAESVLEDYGLSVSAMPFMTGRVPNQPKEILFVSRTGYTGEDGFEVAVSEDSVTDFASTLLKDDRVEWIGLGARDSLRLEAGLPLSGQDIKEDVTPHEAGLLWAIPKSLREGGDYIGASSLTPKISEGRKRMRVGLLPDGRPVRAGTPLVTESGDSVGLVTSGGFGPTLDAPIALGLIDVSYAEVDIFAEQRGKRVLMSRASLPFVPHHYKRI